MTRSASLRPSALSVSSLSAGAADGWATATFRLGANRAASATQLARSEAGATSKHGFRPPGSGHRLAPVDGGLSGGPVFAKAGPGKHAHRFPEGQALAGRAALDRLEPFKRSTEPLMVDLDPLAADKGQSVRMGQQSL